MNDERPLPLTGREAPYQLVMVAVILELVVLAMLSPRGIPADPQVVIGVSGIRLVALVWLAGLLRDEAPRTAWPALLVWAAILWPPEIWAHALEARVLDAWRTALGSVLFAFALHTVARRTGWLWWVAAIVFAATLLVPALSPLEQLLGSRLPWWALVAAVVALFGWFAQPRLQRSPRRS